MHAQRRALGLRLCFSRVRVMGNMQCDTSGGMAGVAEVLYVVIRNHMLALLAVTVGNSKA